MFLDQRLHYDRCINGTDTMPMKKIQQEKEKDRCVETYAKKSFFFRNFCVGRKRKGANSNETEHSVETLPKATTRYMTQDMLYCLFVWLNSPLWCVIHTNMYEKNLFDT